MSHHCHRPESHDAGRKCGRLGLIAGILLLIASISVSATATRLVDPSAVASRADAAALTARLESAEAHAAELARISHECRVSLADELRREMATAVKSLNSAIEAERGTRGSQLTAERAQRRKDVARLSDEVLAAVALTLREQDARIAADGDLAAIIGSIGKRLAALEGRKPEPAPMPMPQIPSKVLPEASR